MDVDVPLLEQQIGQTDVLPRSCQSYPISTDCVQLGFEQEHDRQPEAVVIASCVSPIVLLRSCDLFSMCQPMFDLTGNNHVKLG